MDPEKSSLDSELSQSLLEGLVSALSAAATLQYTRDVYVYLEQLQDEIRMSSAVNSNAKGLNSETKMTVAPAKLEVNYTLLLIAIDQIKECIGPACAKSSRNAVERLKRLIACARKHLLAVRGLLDVDHIEKE